MFDKTIMDKYKLVRHPVLFNIYKCDLPIEFNGLLWFRDVHASSVIINFERGDFIAYKKFTPESLRVLTIETFLALVHESVMEQFGEYIGQKETS